MHCATDLNNTSSTGFPLGQKCKNRRSHRIPLGGSTIVPKFLAHRVCHNDVSHERRIQKQSVRATHDVKRRLDPARAHHRHVKCARGSKARPPVCPSTRCIRLDHQRLVTRQSVWGGCQHKQPRSMCPVNCATTIESAGSKLPGYYASFSYGCVQPSTFFLQFIFEFLFQFPRKFVICV